jgi:malate dehydrogenase (quinone)
LKQIIPSYGVSLIDNAEFCQRIRAETAQVLKVENIELTGGHKEERRMRA